MNRLALLAALALAACGPTPDLSSADDVYSRIASERDIHPRSTDYDGLTTGIPTPTGPRAAQKEEAAPEPKAKR